MTIRVEIGKVLRLEFTSFAVRFCDNCTCDHVAIKDGDGDTLMDKSCGESSISPSSSGYFQPPVIVTNTNTVEIFFHTDAKNSKPGWSLSWAAVTPGLKTQLVIFFLIHRHCINIDMIDSTTTSNRRDGKCLGDENRINPNGNIRDLLSHALLFGLFLTV